MDNVQKFIKAVNILKADTEMSFDGTGVTTESQFNQVRWKTGEDSNGKRVTTTTCPHSEITWTAVKAEMDKL